MEIETLIKCKDMLYKIKKYNEMIRHMETGEYKKEIIENYTNYNNFSIIEELKTQNVIDMLFINISDLNLILKNARFESNKINHIENVVIYCLGVFSKINSIDDIIIHLQGIISGKHSNIPNNMFITIVDVVGKEKIIEMLNIKLKESESKLIQICK